VRELNMIADVRGGTPRWTLAKERVRKTKRAQTEPTNSFGNLGLVRNVARPLR
jgi:hypothetical protein